MSIGATRTPLRALPLATDDQLSDRQKPFSPITSPTAYVPANQDTFDRLDNNHSEYYDQCKDDLEAPRLVVEQIATYKIAPRPSLPPLDWWTKASRTLTACFCPVCLDACNIKGSVGQQAWREKVIFCYSYKFDMQQCIHQNGRDLTSTMNIDNLGYFMHDYCHDHGSGRVFHSGTQSCSM